MALSLETNGIPVFPDLLHHFLTHNETRPPHHHRPRRHPKANLNKKQAQKEEAATGGIKRASYESLSLSLSELTIMASNEASLCLYGLVSVVLPKKAAARNLTIFDSSSSWDGMMSMQQDDERQGD